MSDLNSLSVTGRLTADAERRTFPSSGSVYATFSVANNTGFGSYAKVNFFNCKLLGKPAESLLPYLKKGQLVGIVGTLETNDYTNKAGESVKGWQLTVQSISLLGSKKDSNQSELGYDDDLDAKLKAVAQKRYGAYGKGASPAEIQEDIPF